MTRPIPSLVLILALFGVADARANDDQPAARLLMRNGDYYSGEFVAGAETNVLRWQTDVASQPFDFSPHNVAVVHFPHDSSLRQAGEDLCVELTGGDMIYGQLAGLTAEQLEIATSRFGTITIDTSHVLRISRHDAAAGVDFVGPNGMDGWELIKVSQPTARNTREVRGGRLVAAAPKPTPRPEWVTPPWREEAGQLVADRPGESLSRSIAVPPRCEVEVCVGWQGTPNYRISIYVAGTKRDDGVLPIHFQVWDSDLVLVAEGSERADLALVKQLQDNAGRLHAVLYIDRVERVAELHSLEGQSLARIDLPVMGIVPKSGGPNANGPARNRKRPNPAQNAPTAAARRILRTEPGVTVQNAGEEFRFERLIVRRWDGRLPSQGDTALCRLASSDGSRVEGESVTYDAEASEFVVAADDGAKRIAFDNFTSLIYPSTDAGPRSTYRVAIVDGTRISGDLASRAAGEVTVTHPLIEQTLTIPLDQVSSLVTLVPAAPKEEVSFTTVTGKLVSSGVRSMGELVNAQRQEQSSCLVWKPWGSSTSQPLTRELDGRIVYREPVVEHHPHAHEHDHAHQHPPEPPRQQGLIGMLFGGAFGGASRTPAGGNSAPLVNYGATLYLASGERFPCQIKGITETEVIFESNISAVTTVPRDQVLMWERSTGTALDNLDPEKRRRLLTVPRMRRNNPPTHLLESNDGDFLRGRLLGADDETVFVELRLEEKAIPLATIKRIVWLEEVDGETVSTEATEPVDVEIEEGQFDAQVMAVFRDSLRLTFEPLAAKDDVLKGQSLLLGQCSVPLAEIDVLYLGDEIAAQRRSGTLAAWRLVNAPDPKFMNEDDDESPGGGGLNSPLVGQPAPEFKLDTLAGDTFQLNGHRGKVVVLDFFATWCGPCVQAMPQVDELVDEFADRGVQLVAVNMQEDSDTVQGLLERLKIEPTVVMDIDGATAAKYGVTAIPQTVVIDRNGKVVRLFVGGGASFIAELRAALEAVTAAEAATGIGEVLP